nr:acyl carrier protein [uncultured Blautia sp.]
MLKEVIDLICSLQEIETSNISRDTHLLRDLDMTSMEIMNLCCSIEDMYEIEILDEDLYKIQTVQNICDYINEKRGFSQ